MGDDKLVCSSGAHRAYPMEEVIYGMGFHPCLGRRPASQRVIVSPASIVIGIWGAVGIAAIVPSIITTITARPTLPITRGWTGLIWGLRVRVRVIIALIVNLGHVRVISRVSRRCPSNGP